MDNVHCKYYKEKQYQKTSKIYVKCAYVCLQGTDNTQHG